MLAPGQRLKADRYEAVVALRRGGMGAVWRGIDRKRGDEVALKIIPVEAGGIAAMEREAEAAMRVTHPNVLAPRDTFVDGGLAVLVLELCAGSVADVLAEHGALTTEQAFALLEGPLAALAAAHAAGVVRRDVKPSNLLVRGDGTVLLADFGIARMLADARAVTRSAALLGSLPFMAPEQRRDPRDVCPATDVYAAAATLATMLTGAPLGDLFVPAAQARLTTAGVPDDVRAILARAGSWTPADRHADARALLLDLRACPSIAATATGDATRLAAHGAVEAPSDARAAPRAGTRRPHRRAPDHRAVVHGGGWCPTPRTSSASSSHDAQACDAWQARQGFGAEEEGDDDEAAAAADDAQAVIQHTSLLGQAALGERAGKHARRVQGLGCCGGPLTLRSEPVNDLRHSGDHFLLLVGGDGSACPLASATASGCGAWSAAAWPVGLSRQAGTARRRGLSPSEKRRLPRVAFGAQSHGLSARCLRFAPTVARRYARLASGRRPAFTGRDCPAGLNTRFHLHASSSTQLSWRTLTPLPQSKMSGNARQSGVAHALSFVGHFIVTQTPTGR